MLGTSHQILLAGNVANTGDRGGVYRALVGKPVEKKPLG